MSEKTAQDNRDLIEFWDKVFSMTEEDREQMRQEGPESWKEKAPSAKMFRAAASLGLHEKVLDYGCGDGWAGLIAAKSGCPDVTAVDAAEAAVEAARFQAALYGAEERMRIFRIKPDWLQTVPAESYDGIICSNVLDVVPPETAESILRELARVARRGAEVFIGLNFYMSPDAAAQRNTELTGDGRLYMDGVLRLVSRSDEEWERSFAPCFSVERMEYFAWPGEEKETRRLFYLRKRDDG